MYAVPDITCLQNLKFLPRFEYVFDHDGNLNTSLLSRPLTNTVNHGWANNRRLDAVLCRRYNDRSFDIPMNVRLVEDRISWMSAGYIS
jgi:hypothetical protein